MQRHKAAAERAQQAGGAASPADKAPDQAVGGKKGKGKATPAGPAGPTEELPLHELDDAALQVGLRVRRKQASMAWSREIAPGSRGLVMMKGGCVCVTRRAALPHRPT